MMDLREKIAEALIAHTLAEANGGRPEPDGLAILDAGTRYLIEKNAAARADAVMGVVEEDAVKRRAYTERRVEMARKAEAAIWERRIREQKEEGDAIIAEEQARVRELEKENSRLRVLEAASRTIRAERAEKDRKIIEQGRRIRALEDENQRMREALEAAVEFAWTTPKGTVTARYEKVLDPTSDMGPWWLTVPWRPIKGGHIENFHDRDAALSRAREIAEEEA